MAGKPPVTQQWKWCIKISHATLNCSRLQAKKIVANPGSGEEAYTPTRTKREQLFNFSPYLGEFLSCQVTYASQNFLVYAQIAETAIRPSQL